MSLLLLHATSLVSNVSGAAAGALLSAIWEGTALAVCVALCLRLIPGLSAAARSLVWMNVFALVALLHILPAFSGHWGSANSIQASSIHLDTRWSLLIAGIWAMLSLWRAAELVLSAIRLHRVASRATPVCTNEELLALLHPRDEAVLWGRSAELCTSNEVERPSVFGFFRPRILVPPELIEGLTDLELQQVVLHEMEHLRRADDWTNLLQKMALVLFPLNPVLLWVERRLCVERELACDDHVLRSIALRSIAARKSYAICLTRLAEYSMLHRGLSLVLGAWERQSEVVRRVHRILRRPARAMSGKPAMFASASLMLGALACALALARSPQFVSFAPLAQTPLQAHSLAPSDLGAMSRNELGGAPVLVKAVMPQYPLQSRPLQVHRCALKRIAKPHPVPIQQTLLVLTDWTDGEAQPQLVIAVDRKTRSSYAAVQFANGWLIVQI